MSIDPALGLNLVPERTLARRDATVSVLIPAHNEAETIAEVVRDGFESLRLLQVEGEVVVSASGCTDATAEQAEQAGAKVVEAPAGKGRALSAAVPATTGDVICLVDGDFRYYGEMPMAATLLAPILRGIADVTVADLYWRPLYPQLWLYGFFGPLAGYVCPELLGKVGASPWSGQRAALRELWPTEMPPEFTVDLALLLHWNDTGARMVPVVSDDWTNPQRPKPDLMRQEFDLLVSHGVETGRLKKASVSPLRVWFDAAHGLMSRYRPDVDDPQTFEKELLTRSLTELREIMRVQAS